VKDVNSLTAEVARLNGAIRSATLSGAAPNELSDQRDLLVLRIAEVTGAVARPGDNGVVDVTLGGRTLVNGNRSEDLEAVGPVSYPASFGAVSIAWAGTHQPAAVSNGILSGQLTALNATIPRAMADLDAVASTLADKVNTQQTNGFTRTGPPGAAIFSGTTAANLGVVPTMLATGIAASSEQPPAAGFNGGNAIAMSAHAGDPDGPDTLYRNMMVQLGVQAQSNVRRTEAQYAVARRVDDARESVSGVSIDEEMTNLVAFQHAYSAAAKYITAIDATLDTLINMTR
ncbi:MAG: flagellar basal body rod C-terminal domain-containing protein, partial [Dermatophilaceae bacterium]